MAERKPIVVVGSINMDLVARTPRIPLAGGPARYSELHGRIGGISKKMLTQTLRKLEANGLIERRVLAAAPPGAEYRLTPLGLTLLEPVRSLSRGGSRPACPCRSPSRCPSARCGPRWECESVYQTPSSMYPWRNAARSPNNR